MVEVVAAVEGGHHGSGVIQDFGLIVAAAAVVAVLFYRLKLPSIFGYLLAGLLLGGDLGLPSPVRDPAVIQELSELGVIFLLFFIGMEFDLRRLRQMLWPSLLALTLQTLAMLYLAIGFASWMGWSPLESLFLGSLLAISSSMVTVRILRDQKRMNLPHAQLAVGILVMEDILAVVLLVILTGTAVNQQFDWGAAWLVIFFMGVFVFAVFFLGRISAPRILQVLCADEENREVITIFSVGLVLGISVFALRLDFSPALGAFLAGAILSQTRYVHSLEAIHRTLHDLFSAVFFVTVGMLMKPSLILANIGWVLLLAVLVVIGKVTSCWLGMFLAGQSSRTSFRAAVAKGQIGEFSFIIAGLGLSLSGEDTAEAMKQMANVAYGVAFVTILLTPLLSRYSGEVFNRLAAVTPGRLRRFGAFYHDLVEQIQAQLGRSRILGILRPLFGRIAANFLLLNAVLLAGYFGAQYVRDRTLFGATYTEWALLGLWLTIAIGLAPFLFAIIGNLNRVIFQLTDAVFESRGDRPILQGRMRNLFYGVSFGLSSFTVGAFYLSFASPWLPAKSLVLIMGVFLPLVGVVFWRRLSRFNEHLEVLFMDSFQEEVRDAEAQRRETVLAEIREKYPWDVQVREITLGADSQLAGLKLRETNWRQKTGSMLLAIGRNGHQVFDPGPGTPLFPGDRLFVLGEADELAAAEELAKTARTSEEGESAGEHFDIRSLYVVPASVMDGNTLAGANVRRRFGVSVVGLQRGDQRVSAPPPDLLLRAGDVLYVVGQPRGIEGLENYCALSGNPEEEDEVVRGVS